jgi:hypothetical protein
MSAPKNNRNLRKGDSLIVVKSKDGKRLYFTFRRGEKPVGPLMIGPMAGQTPRQIVEQFKLFPKYKGYSRMSNGIRLVRYELFKA